MSWLRITLDSFTKAVGSTDLISKFSRFKPSSSTGGITHATKARVKLELVTSNSTASPPESTMKKEEEGEKDKAQEEVDRQRQQVAEEPFVAAKKASAASVPTSSPQKNAPLFHSAALSTDIDETYNTLAHHISSYFGPSGQGEGGESRPQQHTDEEHPVSAPPPPPHPALPRSADHIPVLSPVSEAKAVKSPTTSPVPSDTLSPPQAEVPQSQPASPKKGFTHYLSYPKPSVQAFVGSYIAPLVPKFRSDGKKIVAEKDKSSGIAVDEQKGDKVESDEEKAKQELLFQREKIIARVSVDNRTRSLVKGLQRVTDGRLLTARVEELSFHLLEFPETRGVAINEKVLPCLLQLRQAKDLPLQAAVREALALVGYTEPVKGRGIRVLAIDGGGTRGLLALQTLQKLQDLTGKQVHELFDYICGVSTGAILAFMLGIFQIPVEECEKLYQKLGSDVFKQNVIVGTMKMSWSHAFYDSEIWENILKERMGEGRMIESARDPKCPKVSAVSTVVNRGLPLKAYVFRNYRLMPGVRSHYLGDCKHKMWQAIRASSAAPGYFQEFVLGKDLHQDGGLLINNPTALAIHECKCLWPNTPLQCVLSLGTGRHETGSKNSTTYTSLKTKLTHVISSATDTEEVHTMLDALLPPDTYFRFNPYMSEDVPLNENRAEKLNFLKSEGNRYLERNEAKLKKAASVLGQEKGAIQRLAEWAKLKADMYEGLPLVSKL
ncbi:calcium-independent phospholipase A2-gamma [Pholidichthys leucotaenia]